ncbi:MAG: sporulation transcriptional regulator SpoIIID [Clostridia bacterium]|nr:sporulation transcriptional regulator SpoIIID [Clostridia bacterium]
MKGQPEERAAELARYIVEHEATVRAAAKVYGISKSTVHKDVTVRLKKLDPVLWSRVREILCRNREERHLRGGAATRLKYLGGK